MKIKTLPLGALQANCYLISTKKGAIVIDPGEFSQSVSDFLIENKDKEQAIFLTHAHFDHICGAKLLRESTNAKIYIGENDAEGLFRPEVNLAVMARFPFSPFVSDKTLTDGEKVIIGDIQILCLHTPGHTQGSMCYLIEDSLFSGDTLFKQSIGRTDFPTSNHSDMIKSLGKLARLDGNIKVFPGHEESTTISDELLYNPYLSRLG